MLQKIIAGGLGIPVDPDWSWKDKAPPSGPVEERPNINPAPDRTISASGESLLNPAYTRWMEKYGYDYNPDGTPKYDVGYDPQERAKSIGQDKYRPNTMSPSEIGKWQKGYEEERIAKEKFEKEMEDAKRKAEEEAAFLDSPKGRLQTLWADADKRDAILGGITDAMTEVKFGQDAYQSRFHDTQKNIRQNLRVAEATKLARQKAQLDMYKVAAETSVLANPAQYLTTAQKNAMDIVTKAGFKPGSPEWNQEYSRQLKQIVVKDLTSAKANAIEPLYTFAQVLLNGTEQEKITGQAMLDAIESIVGYLGGTDTGGGKSQRAEIVVEEETTTITP